MKLLAKLYSFFYPLSPYLSPSKDAFSLAALHYDRDLARNRVARWSRVQSLRVLDSAFSRGSRVLELGCGTGDEALHLARRGVTVLATDAAPAMLDILDRKLAGEDKATTQRIATLLMPAGSARALVSQVGKHYFEGAYSSFGPLNCEPQLEPVVEALAALVKPGGRVVISLINKYCLWETAWYMIKRQTGKAFRRWPGYTEATVRGEWQDERIPVYYWSLRELERLFKPNFRIVRRIALPWLLPPQYLSDIFRGRPRLFRLLARLERKFAHLWPFYALGDHILFELVRVPGKEEG